jgi:sugar transferase (PEP-CTERM/EpsH1 system associated)
MKILFLSTELPYPPDSGGRSRDFHLLKELSKEHSITLVSYVHPAVEVAHVDALKEWCQAVHTVPFHRRYSPLLFLKSLVLGTPYKVLQYTTKEFRLAIFQTLSSTAFDLILCEHVYLTANLPASSTPVIPQNEELAYNVYKRMGESGHVVTRLYANSQWRKLYRYEMKTYAKHGAFLALSEQELETVKQELPGLSIALVPNGVDVEYFSPNQASTSAEKPQIVFTGSFSYYPNSEAAFYFVEDILPLIRIAVPDVRLFIVGRGPGKKLKELMEKDASITVTGSVPDVRPFLAQAAVVVVPIRIAGGTRLKILEAWSMAKAVVSTAIGCEGLACEAGRHLMVANTPKDFAEKVIELIRDRTKARSLGINGRALVEEKYRWELIGSALNDFLTTFVQGQKSRMLP